jgi:hypothetical protein
MVPEASLEQTDAGLVSRGPGWYVLNAREARWNHREGHGQSPNLAGADDDEAEAHFRELGGKSRMSVSVDEWGNTNVQKL